MAQFVNGLVSRLVYCCSRCLSSAVENCCSEGEGATGGNDDSETTILSYAETSDRVSQKRIGQKKREPDKARFSV